MGEIVGMRIEEIPIVEHLKYKGRMALCFKCGIEFFTKGPHTKYCPKCSISLDFPTFNWLSEGLKQKENRKRPCFECAMIPVPERYCGDNWLTGMYYIFLAIIFRAIIDAVKDVSKTKSKYKKNQIETDKLDAMQFLKGEFIRKEDKLWYEDISDFTNIDMKRIFRRLEKAA